MLLPFFIRKRGAPLYLGVAIHTEHIQDEAVFCKMAAFGRALPFKPSAFVMTPYSPIVKKEMREKGISEETFTRRLKTLAGLFEIGLHGHYCRPAAAGAPVRETAPWLAAAGFERTSGSPEEIKAQFQAEYAYLAEKTGKPKAYSAGWWFMTGTVAALLEEYGLLTDCSLRHDSPDSFGGRYIPADRMPAKGKPFILPPSRNVAEFPSYFYLDTEWWRAVRELLPLLAFSSVSRFAVLPAHDNEMADGAERMLENIKVLSGIGNVKFISLSRMRELARDEGLLVPPDLEGAGL